MKAIRSLRHAFLVALGAVTLGYAQGNGLDSTASQKDSVAVPAILLPPADGADVVAAHAVQFDYAFGDQTAASLNIAGSTGANWGVADTYRAAKKFIEKHPYALRGKNVFVAIGNGGEWESFWYGPRFASMMQEAVGQGKIVLMGLSETRTDIDGASANRTIQSYITKRGIIYGGPLLQASSYNNIYPTTPEGFAASTNQARAKLETVLANAKPKTQLRTRP